MTMEIINSAIFAMTFIGQIILALYVLGILMISILTCVYWKKLKAANCAPDILSFLIGVLFWPHFVMRMIRESTK